MNALSPEDMLIGLVALVLVPLIALRIVRGVREGRMPLYRTTIAREDGRGKFAVLIALHAATLILVATVAADLLLGLGLRQRL